MFSVIVVVLFGTWMSQEASNWLVNGLQPTYKWGTLWLYSTYKLFTNFLGNPSIAMYPSGCATTWCNSPSCTSLPRPHEPTFASHEAVEKKPTPPSEGNVLCRDFHVVNMLMIFLFLDILLSISIYIYVNTVYICIYSIYMYIQYIYIYIFFLKKIYNVHIPPKTTRWPSFLPHVTVRFSCAKATYNNLYLFSEGLR